MFIPIFLLLVVASSWVPTFRPGLNRLMGTTLLVTRVPLLARLRMHATAACTSVGIAVVLAVYNKDSWWLAVVATLSAILLVSIPVSYTITDQGIRLGKSSFRRWTEFAAVRRAPGGARLIGVPKARGMHIWLSGSRGDDEFLLFVRQTLKSAYKGTYASNDTGTQRTMLNIDDDAGTDHFAVAAVPH